MIRANLSISQPYDQVLKDATMIDCSSNGTPSGSATAGKTIFIKLKNAVASQPSVSGLTNVEFTANTDYVIGEAVGGAVSANSGSGNPSAIFMLP